MTNENVSPLPIGETYVRLALQINRHLPGFVDAYFGPPEWKTEVEAGDKIMPDELRRQAEALLQDINILADETRRDWLTKQITAMTATLRHLEGESPGRAASFEEEIQLLYDIQPQWVNEREFEDALNIISDLLPGSEPLPERLETWNKQFEVPPEKVLPLLAHCRDETRRRTRQLFKLPEDEEVTLQLVKGQTWLGYNWYLGNYRSRVEVNTDLPVWANDMLSLMTHECYPGHHTEHVTKEQRLYRQSGHTETCVQLLNAPECVISEGIAEMALQIVFSEQELKAWLRDEFYPLADIDGKLVARDRVIAHARRRLRPVSGNAAFLLHRDGADEQSVLDYLQHYGAQTEKRARQTFKFISHPLSRSYTFNYYYGHELLSRYVEAGDPVVRFQALLEQPLTPSHIERWIEQARRSR